MIDWANFDWKASGSDKATVAGHSYSRIYPVLFNGLPDVSTMIEVGVRHGNSLILWESILPRYKIVGIDIAAKPIIIEGHNAIEFIQANAYCDETVKKLERFKEQCSVIIDDGSHKTEHVCFFVKKYPVFLKHGGLLIVEDIQSYEVFLKTQSCLPEPLKSNSFMVDMRMFKKRHDDILLVAYNP